MSLPFSVSRLSFKKLFISVMSFSLGLSLISGIFFAPIARAAGTPFACDSSFYELQGGLFYRLNIPAYTFTQVGTAAAITSFNAIGFNPQDNLIYGFPAATTLESIDGTGAYTQITNALPTIGANTSGASFATNDTMITTGGTSTTLTKVVLNRTAGAVTSESVTTITPTGTGYTGAIDIVVIPRNGGGFTGYAADLTTLTTFIFDAGLTSATYTTQTLTGTDNPTTGKFGAQWADGQGNFFI